MRYVINELVDYDERYVVEDNADIGDRVYKFTNSWIMAQAYRLWLEITR